jgi:hypothetical protein
MKHLRLLIAGILIAACAHQAPSTFAAPPVRSVTFSISNVESPFLMRAALSGRVDIFSNAIVVVAYPDLVIDHTRQVDPRAPGMEVRVALASGDRNARWRLDYQSEFQPIEVLQPSAGIQVRDSVRFVIEGVHPSDLMNRWLVFDFSSTMMDQHSHQRVRASNFLHAAPDIFRR